MMMNVLGSEQRACQIHHARSWSSGFYARKIVEDKKAKIELAFIMPPGHRPAQRHYASD
jgi:hypothetical protein